MMKAYPVEDRPPGAPRRVANEHPRLAWSNHNVRVTLADGLRSDDRRWRLPFRLDLSLSIGVLGFVGTPFAREPIPPVLDAVPFLLLGMVVFSIVAVGRRRGRRGLVGSRV
jgi:hypothetical protein